MTTSAGAFLEILIPAIFYVTRVVMGFLSLCCSLRHVKGRVLYSPLFACEYLMHSSPPIGAGPNSLSHPSPRAARDQS